MDTANKLYKLADGLTKQIENKFNPACGEQNYTDRRARMAARMRKDGEDLEKVQTVLNGLGMLHENNFSYFRDPKPNGYNTEEVIKRITTKKMVERILLYDYPSIKWNIKEVEQLKKVGIGDEPQFYVIKNILEELLVDLPDREEENKKIELENKAKTLIRQIPGFFPTPKNIAETMVQLANLTNGDKVLEPSAGSGNIADVIRETGIEPDVIEWNRTLTELLKLKGYNVIGDDFLEYINLNSYDKIIMNPPFEKLQDIDHVKHAYRWLKTGGRLVSVMSESPFFRADKKAEQFRRWFYDVGGDIIDLPSGAFKESLTGVKTRIVVIDKE